MSKKCFVDGAPGHNDCVFDTGNTKLCDRAISLESTGQSKDSCEHWRSDCDHELSRAYALIEEMRDRFAHIAEYWNKDNNVDAMNNALWYIVYESAEGAEQASAFLAERVK